MIQYCKKVFILKVKETWFSYQYKLRNIFTLNVHLHVQNNLNKRKWAIQKNSHTLELNLLEDEDIIYSNFSKQIRQQIKISENEGTNCYFHNDIDQFVSFFNDFASKKDTYTTSKEVLKGLGNSVRLSFSENNGHILAAHSYLIDDEIGIVRHLHSATKRLDEQYDRNLIGRANKYLTVKDILYFKGLGFKVFDFGGYAKDTKDESLKGINNYKLLFGGKIVTCVDYYSYSYWLLKKISKTLGLSGKL